MKGDFTQLKGVKINVVDESTPIGVDSGLTYLSNVIDNSTGKVKEPFELNGKRYRVVRATNNQGEVVLGVMSYEDDGNNIIYDIDTFQNGVGKKEEITDDYDYNGEELKHFDKQNFSDFVNLKDLVGFRHFFVNIKTGEVTSKFRNLKEMIKSGIKLVPGEEDYMGIKELKRFRVGDYFKTDELNEADVEVDGVNVNKLQSDTKKLVTLIKNKFGSYLAKLDKPLEQAQFLTTMANEIGVPLQKLSGIITQFKDVAKTDSTGIAEGVIIKKNTLDKEITNNLVKRVIKIKDLRK
jgi:hypothetical protein